MNIGAMMDQLTVDLNDAAPGHQNTVWSRYQLRAYLEEGMMMAYGIRPDLFMETRIIKVETCTYLHDVCDCDTIHRVIGQATKDGRIINLLEKRENKDMDKYQIWKGRTCRLKKQPPFKLKYYNLDNNSDTLYLYPKVPPGMDIYVMVECSNPPKGFSEDFEVLDEFRPALMQWALYRAKMVDGEHNLNILSVAKTHKEAFKELLQLVVNTHEIEKGLENADSKQQRSVPSVS